MIGPTTLKNEIYIRLIPSRRYYATQSESSSHYEESDDLIKTYDAFIYSDLPIPDLFKQNSKLISGLESFLNTPCIGVEQIIIHWDKYQDYLAAFVENYKTPHLMRRRLIETFTPGLERIFTEPIPNINSVRIWWHCETPELEDLPWELIVYSSSDITSRISFVRGQPPSQPVPKLPLAANAKLRLAYIHDPRKENIPLNSRLQQLSPSIELVDFPENPRQALETVAREGYEIVHLAADGIVSLAYEGLLYLLDESDPNLQAVMSARELSRMLLNSRVSLLCLSDTTFVGRDQIYISGFQVPSAYRAFAYFARSNLPLPSVLAPLGPIEDSLVSLIMGSFYENLAGCLSIEEALASSRRIAPVPLALYLRQNLRQTFERQTFESQELEINTNSLNQDLRQSYEVVSQIEKMQVQYGDLPRSVKKFLAKENARQSRLESELDKWLKGGEGEV